MTENEDGMVAIITGAGSGVGEEIALQLSERGYRLVLVGRTKEKLDRVGCSLGTQWISVAADIGVSADRARIVQESTEILHFALSPALFLHRDRREATTCEFSTARATIV